MAHSGRATTHLSAFKSPAFINGATGAKMPNDTGWQDRHVEALYAPRGFEAAIVNGIAAWARYADEHNARYPGETPQESRIGNDYAMGPHWESWGRSLHGLLNGETGRLDCGTLSAFIHDTLHAEGFRDD